ncbi:MAG: hypothetical protein APF84_12165 [Gracilibacter sp. BRH_c7a]|nr:MAG: hypothetical protein APF84_12165 [Gracilibacter sp. BRH_c7a]
MEGNEYVYRIRPLVVPGLVFIILYPLIVGGLSYLFNLPELYLSIFSWIYIVSTIFLLLTWLTAKSKRIIVEGNNIVFRSLFGRKILEPKDIRKASFYWVSQNEEIVQIKTSKQVYYLSNLYFPFNELLTDLEQFIMTHHIRSNLASHYGTD